MSPQKKIRRPKRQPAPRVVYGPAPWDGRLLLVLPFHSAYDAAFYYLARNEAKTWAEFLTSLPSHHRENLANWINDNVDHKGFEEYWQMRLLDPEELGEEEDENLTRAQAWTGYEELSCPGERPPLGHEPFDRGEWESTELEYNLGPQNPQATMTDTVPPSILAKYGLVQDSMWEGAMASLDMKDESEIVALYRKRGYRIVRHDPLIEAACGMTKDPDHLHRLLLLEEIYDDVPEPRPEEIEPEPTPEPPVPPPVIPVTRITADPWLKEYANKRPIPKDAVLICEYTAFMEIDTFVESAHLRRTPAADELWIRGPFREGRMVTAPTQPGEKEACLTLLDVLVRSRLGFAWPNGFTKPGLLTEEAFQSVVKAVEAELETNTEKARSQESEIVTTARALSLNPEPTGTGATDWQAHCPGTNHTLMISAKSDQFGCGYCKVKGGVKELREFVTKRRTK